MKTASAAKAVTGCAQAKVGKMMTGCPLPPPTPQVLSPTRGTSRWAGGAKNDTKDLFTGGSKTLVEFHAALRNLAETSLHISPVFRPFYHLGGDIDADRRRAQRVVLEGSVIKPLIEATRSRIVKEPQTSDPVTVAQALLELIRVELGIVKRHAHNGETIEPPESLVTSLQTYLVNRKLDPILDDAIQWTYQKGDGPGKWPEDRLSGGGTLAKGNPDNNKKWIEGIEHFHRCAMYSFSQFDDQWEIIKEMTTFLTDQYEPQERNLFQAVNAPGSVIELDPLLLKPYQQFAGRRQSRWPIPRWQGRKASSRRGRSRWSRPMNSS